MKLNNEMCLFKISLNSQYKDLFLITLAKLHGVHVKKKSEEISSKNAEEEVKSRENLKKLRTDLSNLLKKLDIKESDFHNIKLREEDKVKYTAKDSHELINHLLEDIDFYTNRFNELDKYISNTKIELEKIIDINRSYKFLEKINLTRDNLYNLKDLNFEVYTTFTKNINNLRTLFDFKDIPNIIQMEDISTDRTAFFIIYPKDHTNLVKERISLIHAEEVPILRKFLLSSSINFNRIEKELELLENYLSKYENEVERMRTENLIKFASIDEVISNLEEYNWAASQFEEVTLDRVNYNFFALRVYKKQIFQELVSTFKDNITIDIYNIEKGGKIIKEKRFVQPSPEPIKKKRKKGKKDKKSKKEKLSKEISEEPVESWDKLKEETPTMMSHNAIFRPFETLTKMYGTPSYSEIDPTIFLFFTFPLLFGVMFGDIGHGLVLVVSGIIGAIVFRKRSGGIYNFSWIIFWCGCWAMLGGLLYGEFFGQEEILGIPLNPIPIPLPFGGSIVLYNPLNNVITVFFVTIFIGIFHMNLGWLIQMVNYIKSSKKYKAFTESLMKILLLDGIFYLVFRYRFDFSTWLAPPFPPILFALIPGILLIILKPLGKVFGVSYIKKLTYGELISEGTMDTFETVISVPSNILSYIRLLALALAHVSLMLAIEAMISIIPGTGIFIQILVTVGLVFGNIVVILLEGVLVFLNALRLNFYEFFFKFYEGRGIDFVPFILETRYSSISFEFEQKKDIISSEIEKEIESEKIRKQIEIVKNYISNQYR
ncbi:MAG: V-type ATPase 116kDa subunit family protein [Candidatus Hermodarchaeota archaeon]